MTKSRRFRIERKPETISDIKYEDMNCDMVHLTKAISKISIEDTIEFHTNEEEGEIIVKIIKLKIGYRTKLIHTHRNVYKEEIVTLWPDIDTSFYGASWVESESLATDYEKYKNQPIKPIVLIRFKLL